MFKKSKAKADPPDDPPTRNIERDGVGTAYGRIYDPELLEMMELDEQERLHPGSTGATTDGTAARQPFRPDLP